MKKRILGSNHKGTKTPRLLRVFRNQKFFLLFLVSLCLGGEAFAQAPSATNYQGPFFQAPYVTAGSGLAVNYTAGTIFAGGQQVAVTAGTVSGLAASQGNCTRPAYSACNIIYATATPTVASTTSIATAAASGNTILAFVQTGASTVTQVNYPWQDTGFSGVWMTAEFVLSTASITPAATAATIGVATQTFTLTGVASGEQIVAIKIPAPTALCPLVSARATTANTVALDFAVMTAAACTPASGVYTFLVIR